MNATVREIWANKFASAKSLTDQPEKVKKPDQEAADKSDHVPCPVCNQSISAQKVNIHLDACLAKGKKSEQDCDKVANDVDNPFVLDEENDCKVIPQLPCPVCSKLIFQEEMNRHLDFCAT